MECFLGTLNTELLPHWRYATRKQARREITEYIDVCSAIASGGIPGWGIGRPLRLPNNGSVDSWRREAATVE